MKRYEHKNMIVIANNENGKWIVKLAINGKITGSFETEDMLEAADVYCNTVWYTGEERNTTHCVG